MADAAERLDAQDREVSRLIAHRLAIAELNDRLRKALKAMLGLGCAPVAVIDHPVVREAREAVEARIAKDMHE